MWPPVGKKKFETLSYLPDLTEVELAKEVDYLIRNKWIPCVEFELEVINPTMTICILQYYLYKLNDFIMCMYSTDLCTVSTETHPDTMTDVTGQCGSFHCSEPPTLLKS